MVLSEGDKKKILMIYESFKREGKGNEINNPKIAYEFNKDSGELKISKLLFKDQQFNSNIDAAQVSKIRKTLQSKGKLLIIAQ